MKQELELRMLLYNLQAFYNKGCQLITKKEENICFLLSPYLEDLTIFFMAV